MPKQLSDKEVKKRRKKSGSIGKKRGPKTILTEKLIESIEMHASNGLPQRFIADLLSFNRTSFNRWKNTAEEAQSIPPSRLTKHQKLCMKVTEALRRGEAEHVSGALQFISDDGDWKSKAWKLERRHGDEFALKKSFDMSSVRRELGDEAADMMEAFINILRGQKEVQYDDEDKQFTSQPDPEHAGPQSEDKPAETKEG